MRFRGWLGNDSLTFRPYAEFHLPLKTVNLVTKKVEWIEPTLPGLHTLDNWTFPNDTRFLPDATNRFVAYPKITEKGDLVLSVIKRMSKEIVNEYQVDWSQGLAQWAPDSERVAALTFLRNFVILDTNGGIKITKSFLTIMGKEKQQFKNGRGHQMQNKLHSG